MDLNLSLSSQEQNDNKAVILTDTTDNFNSFDTSLTNTNASVEGVFYEIVTQNTLDYTTIGSPDNTVGTRFVADAIGSLGVGDELKPVTPTIAEIEAATLNTVITGVDETATTKSEIDLLTTFGPFVSQSDLVFTITSALLGDTADSKLVDGLYQFTYQFTYSGDGAATKTDALTSTVLVYGQVKIAVYEKFRELNSEAYLCRGESFKTTLAETDLYGAYLYGIENSAYLAKTEELLDMLVVLDNIIKNGSNVTW